MSEEKPKRTNKRPEQAAEAPTSQPAATAEEPLAPLGGEEGEVTETAPAPAPPEAPVQEAPPTVQAAPEVIVRSSSAKSSGMVLVANHHTGGITFPRRGPGGVIVAPLRLAPGTTTIVDAAEWEERKKMKVVQYYIEKGLISEISREGKVSVTDATSTDLEIPNHLMSDEELLVQGDTAKAGVRKANAGTVEIK